MNMDASSTETASSTPENSVGLDFLHVRINQDNASGRFGRKVHTRFPPEPNGYLHIGHAKSICINFGLAQEYGGLCNLRFDDTNPVKEDTEYVDSIREDVHWLGGEWDDREYYASNYFDQLYAFAEQLIRDGKAYVDSQSAEEIRASRWNRSRFSSMERFRYGLSVPGCVSVPRLARISSALWLSTYALPSRMSCSANAYN